MGDSVSIKGEKEEGLTVEMVVGEGAQDSGGVVHDGDGRALSMGVIRVDGSLMEAVLKMGYESVVVMFFPC